MSNKVTMVDPDQGWRYGFPKELPKELKNKDISDWLIENGYPSEVVDTWKNSELGYVPCRYWQEEVGATKDELDSPKCDKLHRSLRKLTKDLRPGDQLTIWHDGYQIHFDGVGTSNYNIKQKNKNATKDTI